jgi:hypothetical protein
MKETSVKTVIPLDAYRARVGDSLLYFLESNGASIEDIVIQAIRMVIIREHQIEYERFEEYMDTSTFEEYFTEVHREPDVHALNGAVQKFVDAVYLMYIMNFNLMRHAFGYVSDPYQYYDVSASETQFIGPDLVLRITVVYNAEEQPHHDDRSSV